MGTEHTTLYNDGYALMCGARHPAALGRPFDDLWHDIWDQVGPILSRAYAGESTHMDDIAFVMHRNGYPEEPHFAFGYTPVRDEMGRVAGMFCACQETTGQVLAERRSVAKRERLRQLFEQAPGFMAMLRGPEHVFELVNPAYMQLVGYRDVIGKPARQALPEVEGQGFFELLDGVYAKGEAFKRSALKVGLQRAAHARRARRGALRRSRLSASNGRGRQRHRHLRRGLRRHGAGACRGIHAGIPARARGNPRAGARLSPGACWRA